MILAVFFILSGILIAVNPELLAYIVSFLLIFAGLSIMMFRYRMKKIHKDWQSNSPFMNFFIRY